MNIKIICFPLWKGLKMTKFLVKIIKNTLNYYLNVFENNLFNYFGFCSGWKKTITKSQLEKYIEFFISLKYKK